jgi:transcriptional regulator with XRE-family HTH domain
MASEHVKRMGARIKDRREELGMTQRQLADQVGGATDGNQVSKWERGSNRPSDAKLERLAVALKVDPSYFHTPPPLRETGDLMGAFDGETQLDRIEGMLEALVEHFELRVPTPSEVADETERVMQQLADKRPQAEPAPRRRRGSAPG